MGDRAITARLFSWAMRTVGLAPAEPKGSTFTLAQIRNIAGSNLRLGPFTLSEWDMHLRAHFQKIIDNPVNYEVRRSFQKPEDLFVEVKEQKRGDGAAERNCIMQQILSRFPVYLEKTLGLPYLQTQYWSPAFCVLKELACKVEKAEKEGAPVAPLIAKTNELLACFDPHLPEPVRVVN